MTENIERFLAVESTTEKSGADRMFLAGGCQQTYWTNDAACAARFVHEGQAKAFALGAGLPVTYFKVELLVLCNRHLA